MISFSGSVFLNYFVLGIVLCTVLFMQGILSLCYRKLWDLDFLETFLTWYSDYVLLAAFLCLKL